MQSLLVLWWLTINIAPGNDALYTLKLFMKLAEKELAKSIQSAQAATAET